MIRPPRHGSGHPGRAPGRGREPVLRAAHQHRAAELSVTFRDGLAGADPLRLDFGASNWKAGIIGSVHYVDRRQLQTGGGVQISYPRIGTRRAQGRYTAALGRLDLARRSAEQRRATWDAVPMNDRLAQARERLRAAGVADDVAAKVVDALVAGLPNVVEVPCPVDVERPDGSYVVCSEEEPDLPLQIAGAIVRVALYRQAILEANALIRRPPFERYLAEVAAERARVEAAQSADVELYAAAAGADNPYSHLFRDPVIANPEWDQPGGTRLPALQLSAWLSLADPAQAHAWGDPEGQLHPLDGFGLRATLGLPVEARLGSETTLGLAWSVGTRWDRHALGRPEDATLDGAPLPVAEGARVVSHGLTVGLGPRLLVGDQTELGLELGASAALAAQVAWPVADERVEGVWSVVGRDLGAADALAPGVTLRGLRYLEASQPWTTRGGAYVGLMAVVERTALTPEALGLSWPDEATPTTSTFGGRLLVTAGF